MNHFLEDVDYLISLGVSSIFASPVFKASPGSMHGYDITDPLKLNPEIGTYDDFIRISDLLKSKSIGWIQDIVPNHMAFHNLNAWLMDVLEKGQHSKYAMFFDIDYSHPDFKGRIMVPFLGKPLKAALDDKEFKAELVDGKPVFRYFDFIFPFNEASIKKIAGSGNTSLTLDHIQILNSDPQLLEHILAIQNYVPCYWKESLNVLNYRRFFTVNSLICLNMQEDMVFEKYHEFIKENLNDNRFDGLRIDHIDGLQDPLAYLEKLRLVAGKDRYIVIEKILGQGEELPLSFPVQGTTGYDFLAMVNNLLTRQVNYKKLRDFYKEISGINDDPEDLIYSSKKSMLAGNMRADWENLTALFDASGFLTYSPAVNRESIKEAIGEFLVLFPVYRLYADSFPLSGADAGIIREVFRKAILWRPDLAKSLEALRDIFLRENGFSFFRRCMQFTGPLMAKGVEDTVMYRYNCFISHNEVGDQPYSEGITTAQYHKLMIARQKNRPLSINATSTHDTKRGEDARARLNVISELPGEWAVNVRKWMKLNSASKEIVNGIPAPDPNEEYFIYQTISAIFPFDGRINDEFLERIDQYMEKALREGKKNSDWNEVNEEYENAVKEFTRRILRTGSSFLQSFVPFQKKISAYGVLNSLSQLFLKALSPGVPDFYQGADLWDFTLVDPDNRRPVNYSLRKKMLWELQMSFRTDPELLFKELLKSHADGRIKMLVTHILLKERKANPGLFYHGTYIPLQVEGRLADHIISFARVYGNSWIISVMPLFMASLDSGKKPLSGPEWGNTTIVLPDFCPREWTSAFFKGSLRAKGRVLISEIMKLPIPVFLKGSRDPSARYAGVLAHISSLPGKYGSGDLGPEAYEFADILRNNGQTYWQMLPFNTADRAHGWSPYSSVSAFAGNTIFLSPDLLVRDGLLHNDNLNRAVFRKSHDSDFDKALAFRNLISDEVLTNFFAAKEFFSLRHLMSSANTRHTGSMTMHCSLS